MDKIIDKIAALGVPGLVLLVAMHLVGFAGAAAITAALATMGGPLGILGGIALLGVLGLLAKAISDYGFENIYRGVVIQMKRDGYTLKQILRKIDQLPISRDLKAKLRDYIRRHGDWGKDEEGAPA